MQTDEVARDGVRPRSMQFEQEMPATPEAAHSASAPLTLGAIAGLLDEKLAPVTSSVASLTLRLNKLQENFESQFADTRLEMETNIEILDSRVSSVESAISKVALLESTLEGLIKRSQDELLNFKGASQTTSAPDVVSTTVIGGLSSLGNSESGIQWVKDKLWWTNAPQPTDVFTKGSDYIGLVFAKFATASERDRAISTLNQAKEKMSDGKMVRASPDRPVEERAVRRILFGAKDMLYQKGLAWDSLWVEPESGVLQFDTDIVMTVSVLNSTISVNYGTDWETYLAGGTWTDLMSDATEKIKKSILSKGKGKGSKKGKGHSEGKGKGGGGKPHSG
ncbi:unnamed protein product [Polarella glacialis]|nr:unnamed protein product [Polarella glacialis]